MLPSSDVCLVSCVSKKRVQPAAAKDLYQSAWFTLARSYVERRRAPWFILSAEHGLLHPEQCIAPHEKTLNTMGVQERRDWAARTQKQMDERLPAAKRLILLAGQRYREFLMDYFVRRGMDVEIPLEGLRIGEQLSWLGRAAR